MQNKQNVFSFHLDESLWFKEGQGVRELIGISLEPEITIEDLGDEVRLQGTVDLNGEYLATQPRDKDDEFPSIQSVRIMDNVETGEDNVHYFSHSFPVEVTVPLERVSNMEDVLVDIESFDYELPDDHQLRLHAHISINGIEQTYQEKTNSDSFDESTTIGPIAYPNTEGDDQRHAFPERYNPNAQFKRETPTEKPVLEDDGRWPYKKSQNFSEFFGHDTTQDIVEASAESISEWEDTTMDEVSLSSSDAEEKAEAPGGMDGIKQIFKHLFPNREDTYTQMKMYIAQEDETLATIAEKYEVSVKQLERANNQQEEVTPGQIVYIPS